MPALHLVNLHTLDPAALAAEAAAGLLSEPARLSPKFLYDALGARLFEAITLLPEYDLTRNEAALFERHRADIAATVGGAGRTLIDVGAGDGAKAAAWFAALDTQHYVALDIATAHLAPALTAMAARHAALRITGVGLDFSRELVLPPDVAQGPALVFYPGSSIGNFDPAGALALLCQMRTLAGDGGALLIGVDLIKSPQRLLAAYDDGLGLTAAFNLNLLRHLNFMLGSDFLPQQWRHVALWNEAAGRVEMHLHAREALTVRWPGQARRFAAGEGLHTENAHKWTCESFAALLKSAGFARVRWWRDATAAFAVMVAQ